MQQANPRLWAIIVTVIVLSCSTPARAQELAWRRDYASARKEATETGRPLLLDFGTEGCVWCRKQDATTFRDPRVVKSLNERFIPVKIDAEREQRLTQSLGIESFPTLVLASAEGKVLGRQVGYADASQLMAMLSKAPAKQDAAPPAPTRVFMTSTQIAQARADYDGRRYSECVLHCQQIITTNSAASETQEARVLLQKIAADPLATQRLKDQIDANLSTLQPRLAAALER